MKSDFDWRLHSVLDADISRHGLHWEALDEDISIVGLLAGVGDLSRQLPQAA